MWIKKWVYFFWIPSIVISFFVFYHFFSPIYNEGIFPQGQITATSTPNLPPSLLEKITEVWLGSVVGPTGEKVCVTNKNKVYINGIQIALPYSQDPEVGSMQIDVNFSDGTSQELVYIPEGSTACGTFTIKPNTTISSSTLIFRYPKEVPLMVGRASNGKLEGISGVGTDPGESTYSVYPLWSDVIIMFAKVLAAWWILVVAFVESIKIAKKGAVL